MEVVCPYCKDAIASRNDGVRCVDCGTPHHAACWKEGTGRCTVLGCGSEAYLAFTRRAATRVLARASIKALGSAAREARATVGGKSAVALLLVTFLAVGAPLGVVLHRIHPEPLVSAEVVLGALFLILWTWITVLLYRGEPMQHDLEVRIASSSPLDYYRRMWTGLTGGDGGSGTHRGGCGDGCSALGDGCGNVDGNGALLLLAILLAVVVLIVVGPLLAWLALELIVPVVVLAVYGVLYGALAYAVRGGAELKGLPLRCLWRGFFHALIYTFIVGALLWGGMALASL